jgi:AcrR family transcriptional regulator
MSRPTTISDDQILNAARTLFFEHGFGASTAAIAQKAGVSEGTIFKRFPTKVQLFRSAMGLPRLPFENKDLLRPGAMEVHEQLREIALELISFLRALMPRVMMLWAQPNINPMSFLQENEDAPPKIVLKVISTYFESEQRLGRLKSEDPTTLARMFLGSVHNFVFFEIITLEPADEIQTRQFVDDMLSVFWEGIKP